MRTEWKKMAGGAHGAPYIVGSMDSVFIERQLTSFTNMAAQHNYIHLAIKQTIQLVAVPSTFAYLLHAVL